jgi:hypothetical protein
MDVGWGSWDKRDEMQRRESESAAMALYVWGKNKNSQLLIGNLCFGVNGPVGLLSAKIILYANNIVFIRRVVGICVLPDLG